MAVDYANYDMNDSQSKIMIGRLKKFNFELELIFTKYKIEFETILNIPYCYLPEDRINILT